MNTLLRKYLNDQQFGPLHFLGNAANSIVHEVCFRFFQKLQRVWICWHIDDLLYHLVFEVGGIWTGMTYGNTTIFLINDRLLFIYQIFFSCERRALCKGRNGKRERKRMGKWDEIETKKERMREWLPRWRQPFQLEDEKGEDDRPIQVVRVSTRRLLGFSPEVGVAGWKVRKWCL